MTEIKTVGIKDLKNNLSAWLREVRRGTRILVSDRASVVAELHEPGATYETDPTRSPVLDEWIRAGIVTMPRAKKRPLPVSPVSLPEGTAARLLDEERGER